MKTALFSALFLCSFTAAEAQEEARKVQLAFNTIAAKAKPAVVSLQVVKEESGVIVEPEFFFGYMLPREREFRYDTRGVGSGFIIDPEGRVLTNYHVVEGAARIKVSLAGTSGRETVYMAELAGADPALDLAVLKIKSKDRFPFLELAAAGGPKVGDFAVAVGYPFGFRQTMTSGIVSALDAVIKVEGRQYRNLIQTDAAINEGNSGGPLLNLDGRVIGVNTAIFSPSGAFAGMGFAIPAAEIRRVLDDIIAGREIKRGWLGVSLTALDPVMSARLGLKESGGCIINSVVKGSPAYLAGLRRGDILSEFGGEPVESEDDMFYKTYTRRPGDSVTLSYIRGGAKKTESIRLAERPAKAGSVRYTRGRPEERKSSAENYSWEGAELRFTSAGAVVERVERDSRLFGYLRKGDIIKAVNRKELASAVEMPDVFAGTDLAEGVLFDLERGGEGMYLSVQAR